MKTFMTKVGDLSNMQQTTLGEDGDKWDTLAEEYDEAVYSLTKYPEKRARILEEITDKTRVLIVGCGSASYLQEQILAEKEGVKIVASDFSKGMIDISQQSFSDPSLSHFCADTQNLPFKSGTFDSAVSTNSIIPEERKQVRAMFKAIFDVLKEDGIFVTYLPSFEAANEFSLATLGEGLNLDQENQRVWDTVGWQCFHTIETIRQELEDIGFAEIIIQDVAVDSPREAKDLNTLYDSDQASTLFREHFVVAKKKIKNQK